MLAANLYINSLNKKHLNILTLNKVFKEPNFYKKANNLIYKRYQYLAIKTNFNTLIFNNI